MPATYSQTGRLLALTTPLGTDKLLLERFTGVEALSELFRFELTVLALTTDSWTFDKLLGQSVTIQLLQAGGTQRPLNGIVSRIAQADQVAGSQGPRTFNRYVLEVVPKLWLLSLNQNSRIFQQLAIPDILKQVLTGLDVSWELQGKYEPRDYCVQYRESDFAFASRLMEEEGIWYCFQHSNGSHKLVVADTPQSHVAIPDPASLDYHPIVGGLRQQDRILSWRKNQQVQPGKVTLWDQCFELNGQNLEAAATPGADVSAGTVSHKLKVGGNDSIEVYDYPGLYAQRFDGVAPDGGDRASDVQKIFQDNARTAKVRLNREQTPALLIEAEASYRNLVSGCKLTLAGHPDGDGDYVITRMEHEASVEDAYTAQGAGGGEAETYTARFFCIPAALPFLPRPRTPRPRIPGPQTAVVVGPSGEEIFTDKYGRIKVQFPWDRLGKKDASSSCWVRVGSFWAGKQWGGIHIPRIGHEVIVVFEDGDPDRPLVVGSVYNADNMPPYTLPDNRTQSGVKSRSSLKGTEDNFNELRFEDKKDSEEVYFHAEKDFNRVVENNDTLQVGFSKMDKGDQTIQVYNNQTVTIGQPSQEGKPATSGTNPADGSQTESVWNNQTITVGAGKSNAADGSQTESIWNNQSVTVGSGKGQNADGSLTLYVYKDRTTTIDTGNESLTVKTGNRTVEVSTGNDTHTIKQGNRAVEIDMGNDTLTIKTGNQTIKLNAGASSTEAMQSITLKVGSNSIKIDQSGITLQGMMVKVQGQAQVQVQSPMTQVNGDGMLQLKGGVTMIN
jgi:type VI secretion system secreted protein VgrG